MKGDLQPGANDQKLDLNQATVDELSTLPGIGPKRARAIVAYRERHRFARVREMRRIRGIGPKIFERLKDRVTIAVATGNSMPRAVAKPSPAAGPRRWPTGK